MYTVIIVDDEKHCQDHLQELLLPFKNQFELIAVCNDVEDGILKVNSMKPDLLLLDVEIGPKTGFDLLAATAHKAFKVIFTTGFDKFAVRAFKFNAIDYLLKPVDKLEFGNAIQRFLDHQTSNSQINQVQSLLSSLTQPKALPTRLAIPTSTGLTFLTINDIIRCEASANYTTIYVQNVKKIVVSKPLKEYDEMLCDHNFFRIHQSHLINLNHIKSYQKGKGGSVIMTDNSEVEVSTRRKDAFISALNGI